MGDQNWTKIEEFPEPEDHVQPLIQATLITVAIAMTLAVIAEPVSRQNNLHLFEELPGCQAKVDGGQFTQKSDQHCIDEVEYCFNEEKCSLSIIREERYNDYRAELPEEISNKTFYYRLRKDLKPDLGKPNRCPQCHSI